MLQRLAVAVAAPAPAAAPAALAVCERKQTRRAVTPAALARRAKAERAAERNFAEAAAYELRSLDRLSGKIRASGGNPKVALENVPLFVWRMCWLVIGDATGEAGRMYLRRLKSRTASAAIIAAAFGGIPKGCAGRIPPRFEWASLRARRIVALGLALSALAKPTRKSGHRNGLVMGFGRGTFCALLANPMVRRPSYELTEKRTIKGSEKKVAVVVTRNPAQPSVAGVFGTHEPGATSDTGQVGYFVALRDAGFVYRQQLSEKYATENECYGPSGHACNRYWLIARRTAQLDSAARWALTQALSGATVFFDAVERLQLARPPDDP